MTSRNTGVWAAVLILLVVTFLCYQQGFSAGFKFDDASSISGVVRVNDVAGAMSYLLDGRAGPAGRPLSLATFLMQKSDWPDNSEAFYLFNTLLHLFNGLLIFWLSVQLGRIYSEKVGEPAWFGLAVMALWLTLPLHVSASLMAVQRMTTLSATFIFLGLIGYLSGRNLLASSPRQAYWCMSLSLVLGTLFATLSKESGALLPLYVMVLEFTLLKRTALSDVKFRRWIALFLVLPNLLLLAYFIYRWPSFMQTYVFRSFTLGERLLTESRILWDYLRHIFVPIRYGTGPYQDGYPVSQSLLQPVATLMAIAGWLLVCVSGWLLRKKYPVILFGVLWFLAGHVLESTVVPLELYFEHRNYVAAYGPLLAMTILLWQVPVKLRRVSMIAIVLMVLMRLFVLNEVASVWGQPLLSARIWVDEHPYSARAAQFLAYEYYRSGNEAGMRHATLEANEKIKTSAALALQSLYLTCPYDKPVEVERRLSTLYPVLERGEVDISAVPELLNKLLVLHEAGACQSVTVPVLHELTNSLMANPRSVAMPDVLASLYVFRSRLYKSTGEQALVIQSLEAAFEADREYPLAVAVALAMRDAGENGRAIAFLDKALLYMPLNPFLKRNWQESIDRARRIIQQSVQSSGADINTTVQQVN